MKLLEQLSKRLDAATVMLRLNVLPILVRVIRADGREEILRDVDRSQPHTRATIRYVRSPRKAAE
jgi:hypothetical protein